MKFSLVILQLVLVLAPFASSVSLREPEIPAFIKTLKEMHQGPPRHPTTRKSHVKTRWITQKLDNFDEANTATWQNRILINEHNFVEGSPIFIYLGGEWVIQPGDIGSVHLADIAKEHNGTILTTEHRFFGESIPIKPLSTENLSKYQNVKQALADVVNVIKVLKEEDKYKDSKVVVQGCSYSATMATWLKKLYPDVIVGSWASSAPLEAKVNFREFMKVVGEAYRELGGDYCYDIINNATSYYENLFYNGEGAQAKKELNLCSNFDEDDEQDQWQYFSTVANVFANIAQYQKPENYDLAQYCSVLRSFSDNDYVALSKFVQWRLGYPACVNTRYQGAVDYYLWSKDNYDGDGLAWTFQTCSEFGWFQSSKSRNQPFGSNFPVTLYTDICEDVFGSNYSEANIRKLIRETNDEFGGIENVEGVYFTQGGLDPWAKVGAGLAQGATIYPQASHCSDLGSIGASDSAALRASKERIAELIRKNCKIYLGGEWVIQPGDIGSVHLADIAKEHNGTILTTEHRFFGESIPIKPLSTENLSKYQNVKQALADVVNVIKVLKEEDKYKDSKVVVQGCSYSATMATWLKKLYPDVIVGSWASSAPLEAKVNFREFMKVVGEAYRELGGDYCYDIINNATSYYENLFYNGEGAQAKKELNLCSNFDEDDEQDQWQYFSTVANVFANIAQYQKPENYDLAQYCSVLRSFSDNDYVALSKFVQWRLGYPACVNTRYQGAVDYYLWSKDNYDGDGLAWTFQTCSEFGWFQSSKSRNQPFGSNFPVTLYTDICEDVFGSNYSEANIRKLIRETNDEFGGIENVEGVYFTQGGLDPWAKVGAGLAQGATIYPQASHCSDLGSIGASDSAALRASKERIAELIRKWLA